MTEARCNEIFRTKYPEGKIFKRPTTGDNYSGYVVFFKKNGKGYDYYATSYAGILGRLGFNVLYKSDVELIDEQIAEKKEQIKAGGYYSRFTKKVVKTVEQLQKEVDRLEEEKRTAIMV